MPVPTRARPRPRPRPLSPSPDPQASEPPSKKARPTPSTSPTAAASYSSSPSLPKVVQTYDILPLGNALSLPSLPPTSLGLFSHLPHPLILHIISLLPPKDILTFGSLSKSTFAFTVHEPLWKDTYLSHAHSPLLPPSDRGKLKNWQGTWRKSFLVRFALAPPDLAHWPTDDISCRGVFSDVLYQPYLCALLPLERYFPLNGKAAYTIPRHPAPSLTRAQFSRLYAEPNEPVILTHALDSWPAYSSPDPGKRWTWESLEKRFGEGEFQAESLRSSLREYGRYLRSCEGEDVPMYLFDPAFADVQDGEGRRMGEDVDWGRIYGKKEGKGEGEGKEGEGEGDEDEEGLFGEDLFELFGPERPDFRWLIIGPPHSGSTLHKDPNSSSAYNALLLGLKGWLLLPPDCQPPGVYVSEDEAEVEGPLGAGEWVEAYWAETFRRYGGKGGRGGRMRWGVQRAGEVVYVPSGWWHLVINLTPTLAVTQNFVSTHELPRVLKFMRDKPGQVSGFKLPPCARARTRARARPGGTGLTARNHVQDGEELEVEEAEDGEAEECVDLDLEEGVDPYRAGLYDRFVSLLRQHRPKLLEEALAQLSQPPPKHSARGKQAAAAASSGGGEAEAGLGGEDGGEGRGKKRGGVSVEKGMGFSFDFFGDDLELDEELDA